MNDHARVLVADDEPSIRFVLRETLESAGHEVVDVATGEAALEALASQSFDIAFFDIRMPGPSGIELLRHVKTTGNDVAVVIITAQNTLENAVEAMKEGALDYLAKPFSTEEILPLVDKTLRTRALESEVRSLRREVSGRIPPDERLVGRSSSLLEVFKTIGRVARGNVSVLVTGESGTGKELVARAIHGASPRAEGPFITVNAAAIPRDLLESELFGHERGAFTGAVEARTGRFREASGGTIFLDEIGDMPTDLQAKLLRVLQSGEVSPVGGRHAETTDVRVIAATHRDMEAAVADGSFREDLLYRLRVVPIHMPPLRERPEDIPPLAQHFLQRYDAELTDRPHVLAEETTVHLAQYDWPGNVRELENAIKRALVLASGDLLTPEDFAFLERRTTPADTEEPLPESLEERAIAVTRAALDSGEREIYRDVLPRVERAVLETVLQETSGNQIKAAARLGINRNTLRKKIVDLGIDVPGRA
ncbi:MAG: sigma-54-dependent Fis family transcriptional regulator [bacterium]|nr:sigma-54-dependent Fis family transcriptional regulator [bacterium]MCP5068299.1 sigma-54-dependent Fis family transcriptional regulator [bacterium]